MDFARRDKRVWKMVKDQRQSSIAHDLRINLLRGRPNNAELIVDPRNVSVKTPQADRGYFSL
jgi:hypothetical protein